MRILAALRQRHLAVLWLGQVCSAIGDQVYGIAVIWFAVRVVGNQAGFIGAAQSAAALLVGLLGGVYADRWNRRATMIGVDMVRGVAVALLPVATLLGPLNLWELASIAVVVGGLGALFDPALQASLPALAGDADILQATNGLMDATRRLARILGPGLASVLAAVLPLVQFFTIDALSFGISALAMGALGHRFAWTPPPQHKHARGVRGIATEINAAVRLVSRHPWLPYALAGLGVGNAVWSLGFTLGVALLVTRTLGGGLGAYGLIIGAYGVGNVVSNLIIGSWTIRRRARVTFVGRVVLGGGFFLLSLAPTVPLAMLAAAFAAIGGPLTDLPLLTVLQIDFPAEQIGKVYSLLMIVEGGGSLLGLLVAVPLFDHLGISTTIAISSSAVMIIGAIGLVHIGRIER